MQRILAITAASLLLFTTSGCGDSKPPSPPPSKSSASDKPADSPAASFEKTPPKSEQADSTPPASRIERLPNEPPAESAAIAKWVTLLADVNEEQKVQAEQSLAEAGAAAVGPLLAGLRDKSPEVRRAVAYFLLDTFPVIDARIAAAQRDALADDDRKVRQLALQAVKRMPPEAVALALPKLTGLLDSTREEPVNRADAARLLGKVQAEAREALPALTKTVAEDPSEKVRAPALYSITRIAPAGQALPVLVEALANDKDAGVRVVAAAGLGRLAAASAADHLAAALDDGDERVHQAASDALLELEQAAVAPLVARLEAPNPRTRSLAIFTLGRLGPFAKPALSAIERKTKDDDATVRDLAKAVAESLRGM